jgi:hypothetical protein
MSSSSDKQYRSKNSRNYCEDATNPFHDAIQAEEPDLDRYDPEEWDKFYKKRNALRDYFSDMGIKKGDS